MGTPARAQWNTNHWPSWETQTHGYQRSLQVFSSIWERCEAAGLSPETNLPARISGQRSELVAYKAAIGTLLPYYIDLSGTNASGHINGVSNLPVWSVTGILAHVNAPTNFLDYTPRAMLNGWGIFGTTNDNWSTVGRPHGYTNSATVAGGPFFDASRTASNWYSTDYGWAYMQAIVNALIWTKDDGSFKTHSLIDEDYEETGANWATLRADFISWYTGTNTMRSYSVGGAFLEVGGNETGRSIWGTNAVGDYVIRYETGNRTELRGYGELSGISTQKAHAADLYAAMTTYSSADYFVFDEAFPTQGLSYYWAGMDAAATNYRRSAVWTNDWFNRIPTSAAGFEYYGKFPNNAPYVPNQIDDGTARWVLRWDVSGGFDFVNE